MLDVRGDVLVAQEQIHLVGAGLVGLDLHVVGSIAIVGHLGGHHVAVGIQHLHVVRLTALGHGLAVGAHGVNAHLHRLDGGGLVQVLGPRLRRIRRVGVAVNVDDHGRLRHGGAVELHRHGVFAVKHGHVLSLELAGDLAAQHTLRLGVGTVGARYVHVELDGVALNRRAEAVEGLDGELALVVHGATLQTGAVDLALGGVDLSLVDLDVEGALQSGIISTSKERKHSKRATLA